MSEPIAVFALDSSDEKHDKERNKGKGLLKQAIKRLKEKGLTTSSEKKPGTSSPN